MSKSSQEMRSARAHPYIVVMACYQGRTISYIPPLPARPFPPEIHKVICYTNSFDKFVTCAPGGFDSTISPQGGQHVSMVSMIVSLQLPGMRVAIDLVTDLWTYIGAHIRVPLGF